MKDISMSDAELLQFAIENGMIDAAQVVEQIEMRKRKELLEKHTYKIYQGNDGKWRTYLPDKVKGRVMVKRNAREDVEDAVIKFLRKAEENPTVEDVFKEWIENKMSREEISKSTKDRYERQFEQCFSNFGKREIKSVTGYEVESFALDAIHSKNLTTKGYSNLRTLLFGIFKLAKKKRLIDFSITEVIGDMEVSRKAFRRNVKTDEEQVFMSDELPKVTDYIEREPDIINLGILLMFKTGLRIGELAGLKKCDIGKNVIHVSRTEVCYEDESGERIFEVRNFPKTEAGIRDVFIPESCTWILRSIRNLSPFGEYVFEKNGERIRTYVFRNRLRTICRRTGVVEKSPHKIRKTYGSILIDGGVPEALVIEQMGHTDIRTTKEYYYRNRQNDNEKSEVINEVSGL